MAAGVPSTGGIAGNEKVIKTRIPTLSSQVSTELVRNVVGGYRLVRKPGSLLNQLSCDDVIRVSLGSELSDIQTHVKECRRVGVSWELCRPECWRRRVGWCWHGR